MQQRLPRAYSPYLIWAMIFLLAATPHPASARLAVAAGVQSGSAAQSTSQTVTNDDVMKMVHAHLGAEIIVEQIRTSPCNFVLNTKSLIALKEAGVPDKVIEAMQVKMAHPGNVARAQAAQTALSSASNTAKKEEAEDPFAWDVQDVVDPMTNQHHLEAYLYQHPVAGSPEQLQVRATCDSNAMHWLVVYASGTTPGAGFRQFPGTLVQVQLKLDDQAAVSGYLRGEYSNYAPFTFRPPAPPNPDATFRPIATLEEIANANTVLISFPREDGSLIYLKVKPQDPSFQKFAAQCPVLVNARRTEATNIRMSVWHRITAEVESATAPVTATYTADEFVSQLPSILRKAATDQGLSSDAYDKEADYIANAVKTCARITPEMVEATAHDEMKYVNGKLKPTGRKVYTPIYQLHGSDYAICVHGDLTQHPYLEGLEDVSYVTHEVPGLPLPENVEPTRPDVLFVIYQPGDNSNPFYGGKWSGGGDFETQSWIDGKGFNLTLAVATDAEPLLRNVHIDRDLNAPTPSPATPSKDTSTTEASPKTDAH